LPSRTWSVFRLHADAKCLLQSLRAGGSLDDEFTQPIHRQEGLEMMSLGSVEVLRRPACCPSMALRTGAILAAILVGAMQGAGWCWQIDVSADKSSADEGFGRDVVELGNVESGQSVVICCEVPSPADTGRAILRLVPEGMAVKKGDLLVELDSAALKEDLARGQIVVATCEAAVRRAQGVYDAANLAKREYVEGTYALESQSIRNEIFVADEQLRRAEEELKAIEKAIAAANEPASQLDHARFAVQKARNESDLAKARLNVLEKLTKHKMLLKSDAEIQAARAELQAAEGELRLARQRLHQAERQIEQCTIKAPVAGTVFYENVASARGRPELVIEEGARVRERQPILRLDDLTQLQVKVKIHESRVRLIRPGLPASIRIDALPDMKLTGSVVSVADYPEPSGWLTPDLKEYAAVVRIHDPPAGLRVGFTAEVRIRASAHPDAKPVLEGTSRDLRVERMFKTFDRNSDGRLDDEEFPAALRVRLGSVDSDADGAIDRSEWRAALQRLGRGQGE
jgi:multidrug resistance efflux pump